MISLKNKNIFIAGGSGYLGSVLCEEILKLEGNIFLADQDIKRSELVIKKLQKKYPKSKIIFSHLNMIEAESISKNIKLAYQKFKYIDGLVNATFGSTSDKLSQLTAEKFNKANQINLTGSFLLMRGVANKMKKGGSIVMFASMYGLVSPKMEMYPKNINPNPVEYGAGKAGLNQMVKYFSSYYGKNNIRINAIVPGPFPNITKAANNNKKFLSNLKNSTMLKRFGKPIETAKPTIFLLSDASSYMTGHSLIAVSYTHLRAHET